MTEGRRGKEGDRGEGPKASRVRSREGGRGTANQVAGLSRTEICTMVQDGQLGPPAKEKRRRKLYDKKRPEKSGTEIFRVHIQDAMVLPTKLCSTFRVVWLLVNISVRDINLE